jgi:hypothetical protein
MIILRQFTDFQKNALIQLEILSQINWFSQHIFLIRSQDEIFEKYMGNQSYPQSVKCKNQNFFTELP